MRLDVQKSRILGCGWKHCAPGGPSPCGTVSGIRPRQGPYFPALPVHAAGPVSARIERRLAGTGQPPGTGRLTAQRFPGIAPYGVERLPDRAAFVRIGFTLLDVVRNDSAVELRNPLLNRVVWRFSVAEFARLEAMAASNG